MRKQLIHYSRVLVAAIYYLLVAFPIVVSAGITLQWDANDPAPSDGYNVYQRTGSQTYNDATPINAQTITGTTYSVNNLQPGVTYFFVVRAVSGSDQSSNSNEASYTEPALVTDRDGDGVVDSEDAFPDDPNESIDTDSDGIGNHQDTDDDGDGMPDSYENSVDGLDPLVDDADGDLDGDQICNKDEYDNGTDPNQETNLLPDTPELWEPENNAVVSLTPSLTTQAFRDADGDVHAQTRYQIAIDSNFVDLVFDRTSSENLTSLVLIDLVLDPETSYYWRVRFIDDDGGESSWSLPSSFSTIDYAAAGDQDANGILDSQEVANLDIDLDGDQVPDATQSNLLCVNTVDGLNPQVSVKGGNPETQVVALRAIAPEGMGSALSLNSPDTLTGLISFKLYLDPGVTTASLEIYFTTEAPEEAQYYFNTDTGWIAYTNVVFSQDRKSVTITLEDGGEGDQDGVENGVIIDPAGLGYSSQTVVSSSFGTTEQTTCFIATPMDDIRESSGLPAMHMIIWGLIGIATLLLGAHRP